MLKCCRVRTYRSMVPIFLYSKEQVLSFKMKRNEDHIPVRSGSTEFLNSKNGCPIILINTLINFFVFFHQDLLILLILFS